MKKAQAVRKKYLEDLAANSVSLPIEGTLRLANRSVPLSKTQFSGLEDMEVEKEPQVLCDISGFTQQLQHNSKTTEPLPANWDPRVSTEPSEQIDYDYHQNQMAWTNWESFIDDFQASGNVLPGQENGISPSFNMW